MFGFSQAGDCGGAKDHLVLNLIDRIKFVLGTKESRTQPHIEEADHFPDGIPHPEDYENLAKTYEVHPWVYACVFAIASRLAAIPFKVWTQKPDGMLEPIENEFTQIIQSPNAYMTNHDLKEMTCMGMELTGNGFWGIERDPRGRPFELWPLPPENIEVVTSKQKFIEGYIYHADSGRDTAYAYDEMIHFKYPSPASMFYGQGSITAAKLPVITDLHSMSWNKNFFKNSARPDAILKTEQALDAPTRRRITASWKKMHSGVKNAFSNAILEKGIDYKEVNRSHKDMDFLNLRKRNREEILSTMGVPPLIVGLLEHANYSNAKEQKRTFWENTLIPKANKMADTLTLRLRQLTFRPDIVVLPDLSGIEALRADELRKAQIVKTYVDSGVPINDVIKMLKLPLEPIEGGDKPRQTGGGFGLAAKPPATKEVAPPAPQDPAAQEREQKRLEEWKQFDANLRRFENPFEAMMKEFFRDQLARQLKIFRENAGKVIKSASKYRRKQDPEFDPLLFDLDAENARLSDITKTRVAFIVGAFGAEMARRVDPSALFNAQDPNAVAFIESKVFKLVTQANATTKEAVSKEIAEAVRLQVIEGFTASDTIRDIEKRIEGVYDFAVSKRARRIARTEVLSASNGGAMEGMKQTGVEGKEWLSSRDAIVRETHMELDGQEVKVNEQFQSSSGTQLKFPGDPTADASEIVNCRCTMIPIKGE